MYYNYLLRLFLVSFLVIGCSKDDEIDPPQMILKDLKKTTYTDGSTESYIYENDLLKEVNIIEAEGQITRDWIFDYNSDGKIIRFTKYLNDQIDDISEISYIDENNLEIIVKTDISSNDYFKSHFLIENDLVKKISDSTCTGNSCSFINEESMEYNSKGNVTKVNFKTTTSSGVMTNTYDDKYQIHYTLKEKNKPLTLFWELSNNNRISTEVKYDTGGLGDYKYTYQYEYDKDDYPTKIFIRDEKGDVVNINSYEYFEK